jgi:ketosteroid isomerase-like protein
MSQAHLDLAREGYDAYVRGDLDGALEMMHPEIEAHDPPEMPDATVHRGREAVRRDWAQTAELFDEWSIEVDEYIDAGDEVVVLLRYRGRGRESGAVVQAEMAHVWTFRDGAAIRLRQYVDRAQALEAAGLRA